MASTKIRGITIELNADTAGIMDGLKDINKSLGDTERSLKDVNKLLKMDPGNVTLLGQKQEYLTKAIDETAAKLEKQKELLASMQASDSAGKTAEQQKALTREIEATSQKLERYKSDLDQTNNALRDTGSESQKAGSSIKSTADAVNALANLEAFRMIAEDAKKLADAMLECANSASSFQTAMAKVETLAHAGAGLDAMATDIKNAAQAMGVSSSSFADGVYQAMSAGIAASDAIKFTQDMTKLAIGGFTSSATAVDIVTTAINAYGMSVEDATHIMDNLISTQNLGKTTVDELAQSMGRVIPSASAYSVNIDNVSAAYAELTAKGIKTREATTYMASMLKELGDSSKDVSKTIKELSGQTFGQFMESGKSLGDALNILWESVDRDKEAFMGLWSSAEAGKAAFNLVSDSGVRFNELLGEMQNNAGLADENFRIMANTAEMLDARWETAVENLKIAIGDSLLPVLDSMKEKGIEILEPFTEFVNNNPQLVAALAAMVGGVVAVTTAVTACATAVTLLNVAMGNIPGLVSMLAGGAIVGAIGGLAVGMSDGAQSAYDLNKEVQSLKKTLDGNSASYKESSDRVNELASTIKKLSGEEVLSIRKKEELKAAVMDWNSIMGENNQILLDSTGRISEWNNAMSSSIEVAARQYEIEQKQAELAEITQAYAEAKKALEEANEAVAASEERLNNAYADADWEGTATLIAQQEKEARDELAKTVEDLTNQYNNLAGEISEATAEQEEANAVAEEAVSATKTQEEELQKLQEEYEKAVQSARSSLEGQREAFESLNTATGESVDKISEHLQKQAEGMKEYSTLIAEAVQIMEQDPSSQGLLSYYIQQGPEAAGELKNLVDGFNEGGEALTSFNEACAAFNETSTLLDSLAEMTGAIETGFMEPLYNVIAGMEENVPIIQEGFTNLCDTELERMTIWGEDMATTTGTAVSNMAAAVETEGPKVATASKTMMDKATKEVYAAIGYDGARSQTFYTLGVNIDNSIADGILDNGGVVAQALNTMLQNAVGSIDVSGIAARVNQALGAALGG